MRRKDREVLDYQEMLNIMHSCDCCRLGFIDDDSTYIVPLNFGISQKDDTITLCGDGFSKNEDYFLEKLQEYKLNKLDNCYNIIKASNSILISEERYNKRQFDNIFSLNPLYIRKSEAENKLNIKN